MQKQKTITAVSYIRVASYNPEDKSAVYYQKQLIKEYLKNRPEIILKRTYYDLGVPGNTPLNDRPDGSKLLEEAASGKFGMVLV